MAWVMNLQRFSLHDGPGIRSTAFLMGCNLRCRWCHNPESLLPQPRMMFYAHRCLGCGRCLPLCSRGAHRFSQDGHALDVRLCLDCPQQQACAEACLSEAMTLCGQWFEPEALVSELLRDKPFFRQGGGVTFSGGEALLQPAFLKECLVRLKAEGVHTCVDTAANVPWENIEAVLPWTDLFLVDCKAISGSMHKRLTGVDNARILQNIQRLSEVGQPMWIRIPLADGLNTEELQEMARFLAPLTAVQRIDLFPVLNHAGDKYRALGMEMERFNDGVDGKALARQAMDTMTKAGGGALPLHCMME